MTKGFFSIDNNGGLNDIEERVFPSEDYLQELVASYPRLLNGDEDSAIEADEWLFVAREMGIPSEDGQGDRWSVDHLFLDQSGVPTLVEVKRSTDSRIRREVVGQMLDYAANANLYWPVEKIVARFDETCRERSLIPSEVLAEFLGPEVEPDSFWNQVKTNVLAGKLRLVFLADELPDELRKVIEFLNRQMDPAEVIGIEIKQYSGEGFNALTSRTIGRTAEIGRKKTAQGPRWSEDRFLAAIADRGPKEDGAMARRFLEWSQQRDLRGDWGRGTITGSFYPTLDFGGTWHTFFAIWTDSQIELQFGTLKNRSPFDEEINRFELIRRLNEVPRIDLDLGRTTGYPKIPFSALRDQSHMEQFLATIEWAIDTIKNHVSD